MYEQWRWATGARGDAKRWLVENEPIASDFGSLHHIKGAHRMSRGRVSN